MTHVRLKKCTLIDITKAKLMTDAHLSSREEQIFVYCWSTPKFCYFVTNNKCNCIPLNQIYFHFNGIMKFLKYNSWSGLTLSLSARTDEQDTFSRLKMPIILMHISACRCLYINRKLVIVTILQK